MDRPLHLAAVGRVAAARGRVVGAAELDHVAGRVLHDADALDEVGVAEPHLAARGEAEEVLRRVLAEVVLLDVEHLRERHLPRPGRRVLRVVDRVHLLGLALGVVLDDDLERPQHAHHARGLLVQVFAQGVFEPRHVDERR